MGVKKILCRFHEERTPSMVLYADGYKCFSCGAYGRLDELEGIEIPPLEELEAEPPEDLDEKFDYIESLNKADVRGLSLPVDHRGYYITWPNRGYYKLRMWEPQDGPKYIGARGHDRPLFWANQNNSSILAIVEGEINALSLAVACPEIDVVSPGGVGDFTEKRTRKWLKKYYIYSTVLVVADADKVGAEAIINTLAVLWANKMSAVGMPMTEDLNEVLVNYGREAIRKQIEARLGRPLEKGTSKR